MSDEDEFYYHTRSHGRVFNSEMLIFMLTKLLKTIDVKCIDFEDIKNQQEQFTKLKWTNLIEII